MMHLHDWDALSCVNGKLVIPTQMEILAFVREWSAHKCAPTRHKQHHELAHMANTLFTSNPAPGWPLRPWQLEARPAASPCLSWYRLRWLRHLDTPKHIPNAVTSPSTTPPCACWPWTRQCVSSAALALELCSGLILLQSRNASRHRQCAAKARRVAMQPEDQKKLAERIHTCHDILFFSESRVTCAWFSCSRWTVCRGQSLNLLRTVIKLVFADMFLHVSNLLCCCFPFFQHDSFGFFQFILTGIVAMDIMHLFVQESGE